MKYAILTTFIILCAAPANAGPLCDALAAQTMACTTRDISEILRCIRQALQASPCLLAEGKDATNAAAQPAIDNYLAQRVAEHKRLYGQ